MICMKWGLQCSYLKCVLFVLLMLDFLCDNSNMISSVSCLCHGKILHAWSWKLCKSLLFNIPGILTDAKIVAPRSCINLVASFQNTVRRFYCRYTEDFIN